MEGKELTVKNLMNFTKQVVDWKQLGIQLDIDIDILEAIKAKNASIQDSRADVYIHWLRNDPKASWEKLRAALEHIGHGALAQKLLLDNEGVLPDNEGGTKMLEAASNATPGDYSSNADTKEGGAMKMDVAEHCAEQVRRLQHHRVKLTLALTFELTWLASRMNAEGLLSDRDLENVCKVKSMLNDSEKANILVTSFLRKVDLNFKHLKTFAVILMEKRKLYEDALELLGFGHEALDQKILPDDEGVLPNNEGGAKMLEAASNATPGDYNGNAGTKESGAMKVGVPKTISVKSGAKMLEAASNATPGDYSSNDDTKKGEAMKVDFPEKISFKSEEHPSELTDDKRHELAEKIKALEDEFSVLASDLLSELSEVKNMTAQKLLHRISVLPKSINKYVYGSLERIRAQLEKDDSLIAFFSHLNAELWSFLDYYLLGYMIDAFGSKTLQERKKNYIAALRDFQSTTVVSQFAECWEGLDRSLPNHVELEIKFDRARFTLAQLENFRRELTEKFLRPFSEYAACIYYKKVKKGCFVVTWLLPQELAKTLEDACRKEKSNLFHEYHVMFLSINERRIYEVKEKSAQTELSWEVTFRGEKRYFATGSANVLIIVSSESLEGPDVVPRKKGSLTQQDKDRLTSEGIPPECWQDDAKLMKARCLKNRNSKTVTIENQPDLTVGYVMDKIATLLKDSTGVGVGIHYIGPGRRHTGDWCFKDGFITFKDIMSLYNCYFIGRVLRLTCDCSYSGQWAYLCMIYLDECKVRPCGHSARANKTLMLDVSTSSRADQIPHTLLFSARGLRNDKNTGALGYQGNHYMIAENQHMHWCNSTFLICRAPKFDVPCTFPEDYTWQRKRIDERLCRINVRDGSWNLVFLIDDNETLYKAKYGLLDDPAFYGEVVRSGDGDFTSEDIEWIDKNYPGYWIRL